MHALLGRPSLPQVVFLCECRWTHEVARLSRATSLCPVATNLEKQMDQQIPQNPTSDSSISHRISAIPTSLRRLGQSLASRLGWLGSWVSGRESLESKEYHHRIKHIGWIEVPLAGPRCHSFLCFDRFKLSGSVIFTSSKHVTLIAIAIRPGLTHDYLPRGPSARPKNALWTSSASEAAVLCRVPGIQ